MNIVICCLRERKQKRGKNCRGKCEPKTEASEPDARFLRTRKTSANVLFLRICPQLLLDFFLSARGTRNVGWAEVKAGKTSRKENRGNIKRIFCIISTFRETHARNVRSNNGGDRKIFSPAICEFSRFIIIIAHFLRAVRIVVFWVFFLCQTLRKMIKASVRKYERRKYRAHYCAYRADAFPNFPRSRTQ